jgi:hypothetical protein
MKRVCGSKDACHSSAATTVGGKEALGGNTIKTQSPSLNSSLEREKQNT